VHNHEAPRKQFKFNALRKVECSSIEPTNSTKDSSMFALYPYVDKMLKPIPIRRLFEDLYIRAALFADGIASSSHVAYSHHQRLFVEFSFSDAISLP
jgi:hypothetical protein